jgi:hypothetical protein
MRRQMEKGCLAAKHLRIPGIVLLLKARTPLDYEISEKLGHRLQRGEK